MRINAEIHRLYAKEPNANVVSSAENASSEHVLTDKVAGAGAISRDRDANSGNGIVRSNALAGGNITVVSQATLSTQTTITSLCYSSTPVVTSAMGNPRGKCAWSSPIRPTFRLRTAVAVSAAMGILFRTACAGCLTSSR